MNDAAPPDPHVPPPPADDAAPADPVEAVLPEDTPLPPLHERVLAVLTAPGPAFRRHHPGWGWIGPCLLISAVGLLAGLLTLATVDLEAIAAAEMERGMQPAQREALAENPEAAEQVERFSRIGVFVAKTWAIAGPPLGTLVGVLLAGGLIFGVSSLLGRGGDLTRSISVAAYASLVNAVGYAVTSLALLLGNPTPATSPANLVDPHQAAVAAAALGRLDPLVLWYYVLLAAGLAGSCGVAGRRAWLLSGAAYVGISVAAIGLAALGRAMGGGA